MVIDNSAGECVENTAGVAAPIFDANHQVTACLNVIGPIPRFTATMAKKFGPLVKHFCMEISQTLAQL
jgi:DNA-binding IclR family transcriptional regulator